MYTPVIVQSHEWPWSFGIPEETFDCRDTIETVYYGSPVLSVLDGYRINIEGRFEQFVASGPIFQSYAGKLQLYQMPHGLLASFAGSGNQSASSRLIAYGKGQSQKYSFSRVQDAVPSTVSSENGGRQETELARLVLAWSNAFDDLQTASISGGDHYELRWKKVLKEIRKLKGGDEEPRMALIVKIASSMFESLENIVHGARRLLSRERSMQPAGRISELDHACIHWYVRQPGEDAAQKAAANRQCLLGVSRYETFDTLENRVLKDFMRRCVEQGRNYLQFDCSLAQQMLSKRGKKVRAFKTLCEQLSHAPHLEAVAPQQGFVRPNYVLQNDLRYKKIWEYYVRLLKQEDEEDKLWAWQNRTWNDIASLLLNATLVSECLCGEEGVSYKVIPLATSSLHILKEQRLGCRLMPGSEPGPFLILPKNSLPEKGYILEIVHVDQLDKHIMTQSLGRLGAWQYLVLSPLDNGKSAAVVAVWPAHCAASKQLPDVRQIQKSAEHALQVHHNAVNERSANRVRLHGIVLCSSLHASGGFDAGEKVYTAMLKAKPEQWSDNFETLSLLLKDLLEKII